MRLQGAPPSGTVLCSIIITNYNNSRFVAAAIESALAQTYENIEIIVVDDGSTDDSLRVIRTYEGRVTLIAKQNGGQGSAMNCGFAASRGDIVFFLDSDDILSADIGGRVASIWNSRISKVHFRLQQIGANGLPIPGSLVPPYGPLPSGDLTPLSRRFGFYPSPPNTGNAYARSFLEQVMPIPESIYRGAADTFLIGAAPFVGDIRALDGIGGFWRRHQNNMSGADIAQLQRKLRCDVKMTEFISARHATQSPSGMVRPLWPQHLKERLIVERFGRETAFPGTARACTTAIAYLFTIFRWPEYRAIQRLRFAAWALAMVLLPRRVLIKIPGITGSSMRNGP